MQRSYSQHAVHSVIHREKVVYGGGGKREGEVMGKGGGREVKGGRVLGK